MKFDMKGIRKKDFKTHEEYLSAVWERNKDKQQPTDHPYTKENFINAVQRWEDKGGLSTKQAIAKIANSRRFLSYTELAHGNLIGSLKDFKYSETETAFKHLTTMVRDEKGHFTKFDPNKLQWSRENGAYIYAGKVLIDVTNSPLEVKFKVL